MVCSAAVQRNARHVARGAPARLGVAVRLHAVPVLRLVVQLHRGRRAGSATERDVAPGPWTVPAARGAVPLRAIYVRRFTSSDRRSPQPNVRLCWLLSEPRRFLWSLYEGMLGLCQRAGRQRESRAELHGIVRRACPQLGHVVPTSHGAPHMQRGHGQLGRRLWNQPLALYAVHASGVVRAHLSVCRDVCCRRLRVPPM